MKPIIITFCSQGKRKTMYTGCVQLVYTVRVYSELQEHGSQALCRHKWLITLVAEYPKLYNTKHALYKDPIHKETKWREIGLILWEDFSMMSSPVKRGFSKYLLIFLHVQWLITTCCHFTNHYYFHTPQSLLLAAGQMLGTSGYFWKEKKEGCPRKNSGHNGRYIRRNK